MGCKCYSVLDPGGPQEFFNYSGGLETIIRAMKDGMTRMIVISGIGRT